jgi:hypothetical protein
MTRPEYAPGQAWTYRTRQGAEGSTVVIRKKDVEPEDGEVFHISILGANLRNHRVDGGLQPSMHHAAVARTTLDQSLLAYIGDGDEDEAWMDGYAVWRQAYDNGDAGVFDTSVAEILDYIERLIASSGER